MSTATIPQLSDLLDGIDLPIDWLGLRKVREVSIARSARDGMPQNNSTTISEGVMVEVLVNGQIGYGATNILTPKGIQAAATAVPEPGSISLFLMGCGLSLALWYGHRVRYR